MARTACLADGDRHLGDRRDPLGEPERRAFNEAIEADPKRLISAASLLECAIVLEARSGEHGGREFDRARVAVVPVDERQVEVARAWRRYGRRRHGAALNFGDCFPYALAVTAGEPLLFKGRDFARTDVVSAA